MRSWWIPVVMVLSLAGQAWSAVPRPWTLCLADTVVVSGGKVTLADVATGPVPACAAQLVVIPTGESGQTITVDRRSILRRLSLAGCAAGLRLQGPASTCVVFSGQKFKGNAINKAMRLALEPWLPASPVGAPDAWMEVAYTAGDLGCEGDLVLEPQLERQLRPGRQTVRFRYEGWNGYRTVSAQVTVHSFVEVARARRELRRGRTLEVTDLDWEWFDQAQGTRGRMAGRRALAGMEPLRDIPAGAWLLESDLRAAPVVLAGDPVELRLARGGVMVTVRAHARRDGAVGQAIPVKNDLTGQLVNARVSGPGRVEWRY